MLFLNSGTGSLPVSPALPANIEIIAICKNYVASPADFEKLIIKEIYPEIFEITSNDAAFKH